MLSLLSRWLPVVGPHPYVFERFVVGVVGLDLFLWLMLKRWREIWVILAMIGCFPSFCDAATGALIQSGQTRRPDF